MSSSVAPVLRSFEDMEVGLSFVSANLSVEEKDIIDFARQFDPQPFHTDARAAKDSLFGGLVASGWHTAALTMRLLVDGFPIIGGTIGLGGEAAWPQPVRPGDVIHVEGKIIEVRRSQSHSDRGIVTVRLETKNQRNEIAQTLTAKLLVFRRKDMKG